MYLLSYTKGWKLLYLQESFNLKLIPSLEVNFSYMNDKVWGSKSWCWLSEVVFMVEWWNYKIFILIICYIWIMVIMNMGTRLELYMIRANDVLANINKLSNYYWDGLKIYNFKIKNTLFFSVEVWKKTLLYVEWTENISFYLLNYETLHNQSLKHYLLQIKNKSQRSRLMNLVPKKRERGQVKLIRATV